jgi:hypothetical protein
MASDRYSTKPCVFDGVDFQFWKAKMEAYIQAQGFAIWEKVYKPYVVPENNEVTAQNMSHVEANSKARNLIIQGLGRSDFDRVIHLKSAYEVWKALCDYHEGSNTIKEVRQDLFKKDYMRFEMKPGESLDDFFARFNKILSNLRAVNITYTDAENARQLLGALDMSVWEMKVTSIRESTVMSSLTLDVLYSKLKTHELDVFARKNVNKSIALVSQPSMSHIESSSSSFSLSSISSLTDDQLELIPEEDLALLSTRFSKALQNVRMRKRGSGGPQRCYECGDLNHIRSNCPKLADKASKEEKEKKKRSFNNKKKKSFLNRKDVHQVLSVLEQVNLSDVDSESSEDDTTSKSKTLRDLTGLCLMASNKESSTEDELDSDGNEYYLLMMIYLILLFVLVHS